MTFFKNKKSIPILFISTFWLIYTLASVSQFIVQLQSVFAKEGDRKRSEITYQSELAMSFLVQDQTEALKDNLQQSLHLDQIDFAILMTPGQEPFTLARNGNVDLADHYEVTDGVIQYQNLLFRTIHVKNSSLTLGASYDKNIFMKSYFQVYGPKIVFDIALITLLSGALILFVIRDLIQLSKVLRRSSKRNLRDLRALSLEAQVLTTATQSFDTLSKELAEESKVFASSLGSAIAIELRRGTPVPTTFPVALVRVDLNHFTQKYLSTDLHEMIGALNSYFKAAREIIERYDGLIYEYVGDEIIFFFHGKASHTALRQACQCVRDLFREISDLQFKNFTVKASISLGDISFVKLDQGYSFSGVPLIQSARMLSHVSTKESHALALLAEDANQVADLFRGQTPISAKLKGFDHDFELVEVAEFHAPKQLSPLHFRSTSHLMECFVALNQYVENKDSAAALNLIQQLKGFYVQSISPELSNQYLNALRTCSRNSYDMKVYASLITLGQQYVSQQNYSAELKGLLTTLQTTDPRVRANGLMTMAHFEDPVELKISQLKDTHNRLMADGLYILGRKAVDKGILKQLQWMIQHSSPLYQSSGLYVCSALLQFHREKDPVYFKSNPQFENLKDLLRHSLNLSNESIRKHALNYQIITGEKL